MIKYKCVVPNYPSLTMGSVYTEENKNPNPFNACVVNDDGEKVYVDKVYLDEVKR